MMADEHDAMTDEQRLEQALAAIPEPVLSNWQMRTIAEVSAPRWDDADETSLTADVLFEELRSLGPIPFTARNHAESEHGQEVWDRATAGEFGPIAAYVASEEPAPVTVVAPADLWRRATDDEAERIDALKAKFPLRLRRIFEAASEYRSTDEYWPALVSAAQEEFGKARAAELLASSSP